MHAAPAPGVAKAVGWYAPSAAKRFEWTEDGRRAGPEGNRPLRSFEHRPPLPFGGGGGSGTVPRAFCRRATARAARRRCGTRSGPTPPMPPPASPVLFGGGESTAVERIEGVWAQTFRFIDAVVVIYWRNGWGLPEKWHSLTHTRPPERSAKRQSANSAGPTAVGRARPEAAGLSRSGQQLTGGVWW